MVDNITATSSAASASTTSISGNGQTIAENFSTFLGLLTTQLKNQSPLDPLDTNQFTQQLVQFTSVEQQLKTNDFLEALIQNTQNDSRAGAIGYIGKSILVEGRESELVNGKAEWGFELDANSEMKAAVYDSSGTEVYSETFSGAAGQQTFEWNGSQFNGTTAPDGTYSVRLTRNDGSGNQISVPTRVEGEVTSIDFSTETPTLYVGSIGVKLNDVQRVSI